MGHAFHSWNIKFTRHYFISEVIYQRSFKKDITQKLINNLILLNLTVLYATNTRQTT